MPIRRCDRCGVAYDPKAQVINVCDVKVNAIKTGCFYYIYYGGSFSNGIVYDLCPDCLKSLENWLKNKAPADVCTTDESK